MYTPGEPGDTTIEQGPEDEPHIFSLAEARALLPRIKELFERFNRARASADEVAGVLEELERNRTLANTLEMARPLREQRERLGEQAEEMRMAVREVLAAGVEVKRLDPALIDFPALRDDRIVYLCWEEGEETIAYWHPIETGFAGRRPL